jgi:hypothetical protein
MRWFNRSEFKWLNKQGVESKKGFVVQFTGRFSAEYREAQKIITLSIESGISNGKPCVIVVPGSFARWDGGSLVSDKNQALMLANLRRAVEFQGLVLAVEQPLAGRELLAFQRERYLAFLRAGKSVTINGTQITSESDLDALLSKPGAI